MTAWNTIHGRKSTWPGRCLVHCGFCQLWTELCFHHMSYCNLFMIVCQPQIIYLSVVFIQHSWIGCERMESHHRPPAYETGEILLLYAAVLFTILKHTTSSSRALFGMRLILANPLQYVLEWCPGLRLHPKPTTPRALLQALRACFLSTSTATLAVSLSVVSIAVFMVRQ